MSDLIDRAESVLGDDYQDTCPECILIRELVAALKAARAEEERVRRNLQAMAGELKAAQAGNERLVNLLWGCDGNH